MSDPPFPDRRHVLDAGCSRCSALVACRERISWGTGDRDAAVFVVGEAPAAGHADAYVTNAVKCFPCNGEGSNREPTPEERTNCRTHLRAELETVDPEAVVATGRHATVSLLALDGREIDGFLDRVLKPIELSAVDATLVPVLHPSFTDE